MLGSLPHSDVPSTPPRRGRGFILVLLVLAALAGGIYIGRTWVPQTYTLPFKEASGSGIDFSLFDEVYDLISKNFVDAPADNTELEFSTVAGLVEGLGDQNSDFMDPEETQAFEDNLAGAFEGIGVELSMKDGDLTVVAPLPGSPGENVGLRAGDIILQVNDEDASQMSLQEAVQNIRGPKGTEVRLLIAREGEFEAREFTITRSEITIDSVTWEVSDGVGIITIARFGEDTFERMSRAADDILAKDVRGIVLDLRGNPGGFLEVSVDAAGLFVSESLIVTEEFGDGTKEEYFSNGNARLANLPLVVLVDEGSASASEILAGALQDHEVATLVGTTTFGKGSVQELHHLSKKTSLRLTVARFVLPEGRKIDKVGIEPDVVVEFTDQDIADEKDVQFERALELIP